MKIQEYIDATHFNAPRPAPTLLTGLYEEFEGNAILGVSIQTNYDPILHYSSIYTKLTFRDAACTNMRLEVENGIIALQFMGQSECENLAKALEWAALMLREEIERKNMGS